MSRSTLIFIIIFFLVISAFWLVGCETIPRMPEKDEELLKQCVLVNDTRAQKLISLLKKSNAPIEIQNEAQAIYATSEAIASWVGIPEKEYTGDPSKLIASMEKEETNYNRNMEKWSHVISRYEGQSVGYSPMSTIPWTLLAVVVVSLLIGLLILRRMIL